jgi:hypothetical protein
VNARHHLSEVPLRPEAPPAAAAQSAPASATTDTAGALVVAAWLAVWIPIAWGVSVTLQKAVLLFK